MRDRSLILIALIPCLTGSLISCMREPSFDSVYTVITPNNLQPTASIPAPTDDPILTVTGSFNAQQAEKSLSETGVSQNNLNETTNNENASKRSQSISMDRALIEAVGTVEYTVEDPFEKEGTTFQGVLFRDLLTLWQVPETAQHLTITALNDYQVQVPISLFQDYPILLALKQNGQVMTRDYRGPAMLVTPIDQYPNVQELANREYWIWQVKTIHIE